MSKRILSLIIVGVLTASMLIGCSSKGNETSDSKQQQSTKTEDTKTEAQETVTITFWDENAGEARTEYYMHMIEEFEKSQDRIKVEYLGLPAADALSKYQTAIQAGETPDVGGINNSFASNIIGQDVCLPLDDYLAAWEGSGDMNKSLIDVARQYHSDGKLYLMPTSSNFINLWYNTEMFEEAGLDGPPETWDEFFEYAEALTDPSKGQYGYTIRGGASSPQILIDFLYSYSGIESVFDENGKVTINDPKHVEFAEKYFAMYGKNTPESDITAGWKEIAANFDSGVSAMLTHNLGSYTNHMQAFGDASKFSSAPLPTSSTGKYINNGSTITGVSIFANSKHPDEAWEFVKFLISPDMQSYWNQSIGQMPTNSKVLEYDWIKDMQHIQVAIETMNQDNTVSFLPPQFLPGYGSINATYMEPAVQAVMAGEMTAQEMLDLWAEHLQEEYDSFMSR